MRQGTTPWIELSLDGCENIGSYKKIIITLKQDDVKVNVNKEDLEIEGNVIRFKLTQAETLSFKSGRIVSIQLRAVDELGNAIATNIATTEAVGAALYKEVIT